MYIKQTLGIGQRAKDLDKFVCEYNEKERILAIDSEK